MVRFTNPKKANYFKSRLNLIYIDKIVDRKKNQASILGRKIKLLFLYKVFFSPQRKKKRLTQSQMLTKKTRVDTTEVRMNPKSVDICGRRR